MDVALDLKIETNTEMPWPAGGDSLCDVGKHFPDEFISAELLLSGHTELNMKFYGQDFINHGAMSH